MNINAAQAQVTAISQTILKNLPAGISRREILSYNASSVPIIQLVASSNTLSQTELSDLGLNFIRPQLVTIAGAALPYPHLFRADTEEFFSSPVNPGYGEIRRIQDQGIR